MQNSPLKKCINDLVESEQFILLLSKDGKVFWLYQHHRYLQPIKQARKILLGKDSTLKFDNNNLLYLTSML